MKTCVVVMGIGDGSTSRALAGRYREVVTIVMPGEEPQSDMPGEQFVVFGTEDAAEVISRRFSKHEVAVKLPDTDFVDLHPCGADPEFRAAFCLQFYTLLGERPLWMGDSVTDCLQGAWHIAAAAHLLVGAPRPDEVTPLDVPVLAIATGPSLSKHIDAIRALQGKALIICADSALSGLLRNGIRPDIVTPLERVPEVVRESFPDLHYPGVVFAGTPVVHHAIAPKFDRHILIPGSDLLFSWAGCKPGTQFFYGQSTATLAVALGLRLSTGPVYLIGHDLCYDGAESHWGDVHPDVKTHAAEGDMPVMGNDGTMKMARTWWATFRRELGDMARSSGRIININAIDGTGALITGARAEPLPDPATLPGFTLEIPPPSPERTEAFADKLAQLPDDVRDMLVKLSVSRVAMDDLNLHRLCPGPNKDLLAYLLRSILASVSMDHFSGNPNAIAAQCGAQAMRNALRGMMGTFERMAQTPICRIPACIPA